MGVSEEGSNCYVQGVSGGGKGLNFPPMMPRDDVSRTSDRTVVFPDDQFTFCHHFHLLKK